MGNGGAVSAPVATGAQLWSLSSRSLRSRAYALRAERAWLIGLSRWKSSTASSPLPSAATAITTQTAAWVYWPPCYRADSGGARAAVAAGYRHRVRPR